MDVLHSKGRAREGNPQELSVFWPAVKDPSFRTGVVTPVKGEEVAYPLPPS